MTTAEMLASVEAQIRKDVPRLMELREGCKFHSGYGVETIVCIKEDKEDVFIFKDLFSNIYETNEIPQHYKIIGHNITLSDVLKWFSQLYSKNSSDDRIPTSIDFDGMFLRGCFDKELWDLSSPYLKDQSEELIKLLYDLKQRN